MGAGASGVTIGPSSTQISPLHNDDPDTIFGDDHDDFQDFHYSSFNVQPSSDDKDEPMTKEQFKTLNEKLDTLLESSKTSTNTEYTYECVKAIIATFTKKHAKSLDASTKVVENSEKTIHEATEKVEKLVNEVTKFMVDFRWSLDKNTEATNKIITSLGSNLQTDKVAH